MKETIISYWADNAKYSKELNELYDALVPERGKASTLHGELVRIVGRFTHEYNNNGNINAVNQVTDGCNYCHGYGSLEADCGYCGGDGEIDCYECNGCGCDECGNGQVECDDCFGYGTEEEGCYECDGEGDIFVGFQVDGFYQDMLDFVYQNVPDIRQAQDRLVALITDEDLNYHYKYNQSEVDIYNNWADKIAEFILSTENKEIE